MRLHTCTINFADSNRQREGASMTKSEQAIRLIIQEGITAAEAADRVGISRAAVSKAKLHPSKTSQNIRKLCEMHGEIEKLTAQRDTLLAALESISKITYDAGFNIGGPLEHCQGDIDQDEAKRLLSLACEYLKDTSKAAHRAIDSVKGGAA